jgi:hypothetical protein
MTAKDKFTQENIIANGGRMAISSAELTELAWPTMSRKARNSFISSWFLTGKPFPEFTRYECGCLPDAACPHALAHVFSIPAKRAK